MVEKEGLEGEEAAKQAYRAAREDSDRAAGMTIGNKASSVLIDRVMAVLKDSNFSFCFLSALCSNLTVFLLMHDYAM